MEQLEHLFLDTFYDDVRRKMQKQQSDEQLLRRKTELLGRITGCDLIAKEAVYHESCRKTYTARADRTHHMVTVLSSDDVQASVQQRAAYNDAFLHVCDYIKEEVICNGRVIRLSNVHGT